MVKGFTAKDKVIVHLLEYYDKQDKYPQPAEITQEGIAKSIGSKQNTVSYAVRNLVKEDILDERTTRVEGKKQRRKGYFLSDKGVEKARKKKQEMERTRVTLSLDGEDREVMMMDVNKYLHTNFSMIEILNRIEDGKIEYSIEEKEKDLVSYLVDMPEPPIYSLDNMGPLERWWEENENNISLLESKDGVDRTIILTSFIEKLEGQVNLFYFKLDEWHTPRYLLNQFAGFLSKSGEHRLASYLEASEGIDYIEIFTNFRKDLDSLSSSLMVVEDVPEDEELIRLIGRISKNIEEQPDIKLVLTTDIKGLENEIDISPKKIRLSKGTASNFYQRSSQYYGITDENEDVIGTILNNRLTSEEYLALSYISIFRKPVEKSEIITLEHVNEMTLKNLLQTPLLNQTLEGKPILPVILKERLRGMMINTYRRTLHEKASDYYCGIPARDPSESIECAFHSAKAGDYKILVDELMGHGREILKAGLSKSLLYILDIIDMDGMLDEDRAIVDYFAGESHRIEKDYGKAMSRFTSMIERTDDPVMLARAHEGIGDIKVERSDYESAIEEYMQSEDLLEDSLVENEPLLGRIYFKVAHLSNEQGDYIEAKEYLKKSISILEHRSRYSLLTSSHFLLARIERGRGKWEEALDNFKKGVDSWKKINESYQRVGKLHDIGSFYKVIRELSNAEKFLKETIDSCEKFGYRHLKAQALLTLSECHLEKGDYDEAIKTAEEANDIFGSLGKEEEQGYVHALFGQIYIKLKMEDKAEDHLSRAISIYQKLGSSYSLGLAYFSMAKLQERKGNQQGIADNYRKALLSITSSGADEMAQKIKKEMRTVPLSM